MNISRQYGLYIAMLFGILSAAVPLLGMWAERTHRPIRFLESIGTRALPISGAKFFATMP
jgi:hypothetical protein